MKRWLLVFGCLFLGIGVFFDFMPIELIGAIWQMFGSQSTHVYYRVVPIEHPDPIPIAFVLIGIAFIIAGVIMRRAKPHL